jgi:hypothetical protein
MPCPPDWHGAIIGMPLKISERVVGVMNIFRSQPYAFSEANSVLCACWRWAHWHENARLYMKQATRPAIRYIARSWTGLFRPAYICRYLSYLYPYGRLISFDRISINLLEDDEIWVTYVTDREDRDSGKKQAALSLLPPVGLLPGPTAVAPQRPVDSRFSEDEQLVIWASIGQSFRYDTSGRLLGME